MVSIGVVVWWLLALPAVQEVRVRYPLGATIRCDATVLLRWQVNVPSPGLTHTM